MCVKFESWRVGSGYRQQFSFSANYVNLCEVHEECFTIACLLWGGGRKCVAAEERIIHTPPTEVSLD